MDRCWELPRPGTVIPVNSALSPPGREGPWACMWFLLILSTTFLDLKTVSLKQNVGILYIQRRKAREHGWYSIFSQLSSTVFNSANIYGMPILPTSLLRAWEEGKKSYRMRKWYLLLLTLPNLLFLSNIAWTKLEVLKSNIWTSLERLGSGMYIFKSIFWLLWWF